MNSQIATERGFCSLVSKELGEDPIGTVSAAEQFLVIEGALPWPGRFDGFTSLPEGAVEYLIERIEQGMKLRPLVIAPDRDYSVPGMTRVMRFRKPAGPLSAFMRDEYLVPHAEAFTLMCALVEDRPELAQFAQYRQHVASVRDMLVCTHGTVDAACAKFGFPLYLALFCRYAQPSHGALRVWRVCHFGGHRFAPTLIDLPSGRCWGHVSTNQLDGLVHQEGEAASLRDSYRGWAALATPYECVAEREAWQREGWRWFGAAVESRLLREDERGGEVELGFTAADGTTGRYRMHVEVSGTLLTQGSSGSPERLEVPQYRVVHCQRIIQVFP